MENLQMGREVYLLDRIVALEKALEKVERERDALAAALDNCNKEWMDALESVRAEVNSGVQFENPFLAVSARKALATLDDRWTPAAILAARDQSMKREGGRAALKCRDECGQCKSLGYTCHHNSTEPNDWGVKDCPECGTNTWEPKE